MPPRFRPFAPIVIALLVAGAACSSEETSTVAGPAASISPAVTGPSDPLSAEFTPAADGTLLTWSMIAGECFSCGFDLAFGADGTAVYTPLEGTASVSFDVDGLRTLLDDLDPSSLVTGTTDCGREVDGNAPSLTLYRANAEPLLIDDCYTTIDREHPLMVTVLDVLAAAESLNDGA